MACCLACCGNAIHHKISKSMSFIAAIFVCQHKALVGNPWMWCSYDRCFGNVNNKIAHPTPCFSQMNSNIFHSFLCFFQEPQNWDLLTYFCPNHVIDYTCIFLGCFENMFLERFFPIDVEVSLRCFDTNGCKSGERFGKVCVGVIVQLIELARGYY